jgi:hypothetical protein
MQFLREIAASIAKRLGTNYAACRITMRIVVISPHGAACPSRRVALRCGGHHIISIANFTKGLALVTRTRPGEIITDAQVPELDGLAVVRCPPDQVDHVDHVPSRVARCPRCPRCHRYLGQQRVVGAWVA